MTTAEYVYRSILSKISHLPLSYLQQVDNYLKGLNQSIEGRKKDNKDKILSLAGSWNDMSDADFDEYLQEAKATGEQMFSNRDFDCRISNKELRFKKG